MKFACDKCDTKYSIADEKVRGKVLKIRCKKCENIIVLREPKQEEPRGEEPTRAVALDPATLAQLRNAIPDQGPSLAARAQAGGGAVLPKRAPTGEEGQDSTRVVGFNEIEDALRRSGGMTPQAQPAVDGSAALRAATPAPAPSQSADWYLAIKGQQIGPLTPAQVAARMSSGEVDERTYGWRDGMGDWKRISDIPELKGLMARPAPPPPPPMPPPAPRGDAQVVDLQAEMAKRQRKPAIEEFEPAGMPPMDQDAPHDDPLAAMLGDVPDAPGLTGASPLAASAEDPFASVPDSAAAAEGPPRESTRMFIAAAGLANRGKKHKVYAGIGGAVVLALATVLYLDAAGIYQIPIVTDVVSYTFETLNVEQPTARRERIEADDVDVSALWKKKQELRKARKGGAGGDGPSLEEQLKGAQAGGGTELYQRGGDNSAADVDIKSDTEASLKLRAALAANGMKRATISLDPSKATPEARQKAGQAGAAETPLSAEQIMKVVTDQKSSLNQCAQEAAREGEKWKKAANVTVTIGPSGKVMKVAVSDPELARMTLGKCLGRALGRWMFPRFSGEPFEAEIPLKLSVGG